MSCFKCLKKSNKKVTIENFSAIFKVNANFRDSLRVKVKMQFLEICGFLVLNNKRCFKSQIFRIKQDWIGGVEMGSIYVQYVQGMNRPEQN